MLQDIHTLPDQSRVWIYQSDKAFTEDQVSQLEKDLSTFLTSWTAHGAALKAGFEVKHERFIVIALDQSQESASGCSIDSQVRFIQSLQEELDVDLLDKMNVTYYQNDRIHFKTLIDFKKMVKDGAVGKNTIVFNNLVTNLEEYNHYWEVPASESWHSRFLRK
ncbi:MAG: tRNA U34 5-methylaminomethyl-2-thiouridine-forming methyltransferase MnmC [Dokdonia sp.]|jgi:tRNA U34 5-methylaminomethyl-2-thiouridine-forming methyltransferase MnmC